MFAGKQNCSLPCES